MEYVMFLLAIVVAICIYVIINLLRKNEALEDYIGELEEFCLHMQTDTKKILNDLNRVDIKGAFASDDEVGIIFDGIKGMVQKLKVFLNTEE